jgi:hypothetical protein
MDATLKAEWERLKKVLSSENWNAGQEATFFGFFCHGWYGRLNEAAYQAENKGVANNVINPTT